MKGLPWIIAGAGFGLALYVVLNQPGPKYATGSDTVEDAAGETSLWGTKQRLEGAGAGLIGRLKQGVGDATGNADLIDRGVADQVVGETRDAAGKIAQAVGETIHDLNR